MVSGTIYEAQLYEDYLQRPESVSQEWREYFNSLGEKNVQTRSTIPQTASVTTKQSQVFALIHAYRTLGHLQATVDPLRFTKRQIPELALSTYGLNLQDLETCFAMDPARGEDSRPLKAILEALQRVYCGTVASEYMHILDIEEKRWVQKTLESAVQNTLPSCVQESLLYTLMAAENLEKYLGARYPGAKRFSIEGTDSLLVALETAIQNAGEVGFKEVVLCMAHRGRLNVLVNILGKLTTELCEEFEGKRPVYGLETGDVKYHQGFSSTLKTPGGDIQVSLLFNPSHLEIVTPVACGSVKARQLRRQDTEYEEVLSIAVHGDAAFSGQGVVMETFNMSQTVGFSIGGTIHIIVNNQIGFTTSKPEEARSTLYCSDIGKMFGLPILHVNADDPEAVFNSIKIAIAYRKKFKKDIIIDLVGYRRYGHNEADEPSVTQPMMYQQIRSLPTVSTLYSEKLIKQQVLSSAEREAWVVRYRNQLENHQCVAIHVKNSEQQPLKKHWLNYTEKNWRVCPKTGVEMSVLKKTAIQQTVLPQNFSLHPRVQKVLEDRKKMTAMTLPIDWGYAENLAYATLLQEGYLVRLSGQDVGRGTFFHRHAVLHDQNNGTEYIPLEQLGQFQLVQSLLSETAVLAFEYGISQVQPNSLIVWEAQFGDFANNAQVVIDQFLSSAQQKWGRYSGITLLLPHGYEGQGAEHSSARLERYLQLCAEENLQVCWPTTPAQFFHLLRRQVLRVLRKPLVVMSPKSLLRHPLATSALEELVQGSFLTILPETERVEDLLPNQLILCSGKVYYDLLAHRREIRAHDVPIIRIEQLYPFPDQEIMEVLSKYPTARHIIWCQEEPENQGAWRYLQPLIQPILNDKQTLRYVGRSPAAAPAVGYSVVHKAEQSDLLNRAFL